MKRATSKAAVWLSLIGVAAGTVVAVSSAPAMSATQATDLDATLFDRIEWRNIGPANQGGRIADFAVARRPGAPDVLFVATASGGLWRTDDQGSTWDPVFDDIDGFLSIGAVATAPSNPNVVWVGTGEANNRQSSPWGDGVYRSLDSGDTWERRGLEETRHVGRIVVHPDDPGTVYVAAVGHLWGPNEERGVYRTRDGGDTWERVLYIDEDTGASDLVMDPSDPDTLFAAMYQRRRKAWGFAGGGPGSGIYRTRDGGDTWQELTDGLPAGDKGRIGLAIYSGDPRVVYAIVEADPPRGRFAGPPPREALEGGVFRSDDRGGTWEQISDVNPRPMYFSQVRIDPRDAKRVYVLGTSLLISDDGGRTFEDRGYAGRGLHPDFHAMWIDPRDPNHLIVGNDGGVSISWDRGESWRFLDNMPIGQFYDIAVDMRDPYYVCGGFQDNGSWCVPSATRHFVGFGNFGTVGIVNADNYNIGGGDGMYTQLDPEDPTIVFTSSQGGNIRRLNLDSGESQAIRPLPATKPEDDDDGYRWNWNSPFVISAHDRTVVYAGANRLLRSPDRGVTWEEISPDLTTQTDRDELEMMGRKVTDETLSRNDGVSSYGNLTTVSESPLDPQVLYTGSDDGQVHVTRDGGRNWTNITDIQGLPPFTYVSRVVASRHAPGRVYATFDGHYNDHYGPYAYVSEDFGRDWRSIIAGLPEETSANVIVEHPRNPDLLFLGHEKGVHVSLDRGATWLPLRGNLPPVPVDDLEVHPRENDLVAGTHGRSIWILDDIGFLETLAGDPGVRDRLVPPRPAEIFNTYQPRGWFVSGQFIAPNPDYGALVTYFLAEPAESVVIRVRDAGGNLLRTLEGPTETGLHRIAWDLRLEPPYEAEEEGAGGFGALPRGPAVLPGEYGIALEIGRGEGDESYELTGTVMVEGDHLVEISDADRTARQAALIDVYELQGKLHAVDRSLREIGERLDEIEEVLTDDDSEDDAGERDPERDAGERGAPGERGVADSAADARQRFETISEELEALREDLPSTNRAVGNLFGSLDAYTGAPRPDQLRQIEWAREDAGEAVERANRLIEVELPALYEALRAEGLWPAPMKPIGPPRKEGG